MEGRLDSVERQLYSVGERLYSLETGQVKVVLVAAVAILFAFGFVPVVAHEVPEHVVISEVCVRGAGGAFDEFVELYNPTDSEIHLGGWKLQYKSATGTEWRSKVGEGLPADEKIGAHKFFLLAGKLYTGDTIPDYRHYANWSLSDSAGHVRIIDAEGNEIDRVGYGKDADTPEGSPAPEPPEGKSIERKHLVYGYAPCKDTNNNSEDFEIKTPTPKNSSFAMDPLPPPPGHVVISEIYVNAIDEYDSEWVELYNPTGVSVDISGWTINSSSTATYANATIPSGKSIKAHGFYLIADGGFSTGKDNPSWPDADYEETITLTNTNGWIRLIDSSGNIVDLIGWGSAPVNETLSFQKNPAERKSIERKSLYDGYAPCQDTNNNSEDLFERDMPTPENSSRSMNPVPSSVPVNPMPPPLSVPEFSLTGLLALIGITSIVLAIAIWGRNTDYTD